MSIELSEFWSRLVHSGIASASQCKSIVEQYRSNRGSLPANDPGPIANFLVETGVVTPFQSQSLLADQPIQLRLMDFLIRNPKAATPLNRFAEVQRISNDKDQSNPAQFGVLIRTAAGNSWLTKHAKIQGSGLQSYEIQTVGEHEIVFSPIGVGRSLLDRIQQNPSAWPISQTCQLGMKIASVLSLMHRSGLVHASVRCDRIWIREDGKPLLLRDPSGPAVVECRPPNVDDGSPTANGWLETTDSPQSYIAPELLSGINLSDRNPTPLTDIYSLGCLLFRLATGRKPIDAKSVDQTLLLHASEVPTELSQAIEQGENGDPLFRVLAYAMAKSPEARFADMAQFQAALEAVAKTQPSSTDQRIQAAKETKTADDSKRQTNQLKNAPPRTFEEPTSKKTIEKNVEPKATKVNKSKPEIKSSKPSVAAVPPATSKADSTKPVNRTPETTPKPKKTATEKPTKPPESKPTESKPTESKPTAPVQEQPEPQPARVRRPRRERNRLARWILAGMVGIICMQMIALALIDPTQPVAQKRRPEFRMPAVIPPVSNRRPKAVPQPPEETKDTEPPVAPDRPSYQLVQDDRLLYASPGDHNGSSIGLELLPPGPSMIVSLRLAELSVSPTGQSMLDAFAPELPAMVDALVQRVGVPVEAIQRVTLALHTGQSGIPKTSFSVTLSEPRPLDGLLERWDVSPGRTRDGATIYAGDQVDASAFYLPPEQVKQNAISRFAMGPMDQITELASIEGSSIPLPRSSKTLWDATNQRAEFCMMSASNFLFSDGRSLLLNGAPEVIDPMRRILIPDTAAVLVIADFDDDQVYGELRLAAAGGTESATLSRRMADTIKRWPAWADDFLVTSSPDQSWRPLATRLPKMIGYIADRFRVGVADQTAVANVYLPGQAASQISLGAALALNTPPNSAITVSSETAEALSLAQILDRPMSVSFDQESLEFAIDAIVDSLSQQMPAGTEVPKIRIIGGDLQLMGITQNQQIRGFAKDKIALRTVLTDLVVAANPDKSAVGPTDPKQSLIWVVAAAGGADEAEKQILITTRQAAKTKDYTVPPDFQAPKGS